jgi:uncharacterized membrane protein HdeD (DUF308 family)
MLRSLSSSLLVRGLLGVAVGIVALAWPAVTVYALVVLFAVLAFTGAGQEAVQAFRGRTARPVLQHLLLGLIDVAAGVVALVWPTPTAVVLVLIVAGWAVAGGVLQLYAAFRAEEIAGTGAAFILGGLVTIAFGIALFAHPDMGALALALLFGMYNLIYGAGQFCLGIELRQTGQTLRVVGRERLAA